MSKVMLVSEDKDLAQLLGNCLRDSGAQLSSVYSDYSEAMDGFQQERPDLVVLETFLRESTGSELLKTLKRMNDRCNFLMLCRLRTRMAVERAFRSGAQDVLILPVSEDTLRDTILHRLQEEQEDVQPPQGAAELER